MKVGRNLKMDTNKEAQTALSVFDSWALRSLGGPLSMEADFTIDPL